MASDDVGVKTLLRQVARPKACYPCPPLHVPLHTPLHSSRQSKHADSSDDDILVIEEEQPLKACPTDLQCGECSESFTAYPVLSAHLTYSHGNHDVFECGLCLKFFICHLDLENHLLDAHLCLDRGVSDMRLCNINEGEISHFMSYAAHREQVRLQCPYCSCEFGKLALYQHHMSSAHHGRAWNKEGLCEAVLKVTPTGPVHRSSKPTIEVVEEQLRSKVFTCSYCNKHFFGKEPMRRHAALHRADNTFQCSQCSCYFSSESRLEEHMTQQHILQDQENIRKNLHGDIIGTSLEDVLNANDSLATGPVTQNGTLATPSVKTTMRKSSTWSKPNKPPLLAKAITSAVALTKATTKPITKATTRAVALPKTTTTPLSKATTAVPLAKATTRPISQTKPLSKATTRAVARPKRILPKLAPKPSRPNTQVKIQLTTRPKLSITSVKSHCAGKTITKPASPPTQKRIPITKPQTSLISSQTTFVKLPNPIPPQSQSAASAIARHVQSEAAPDRQSAIIIPAKLSRPSLPTAKQHSTAIPIAKSSLPHGIGPVWKGHKRTGSEDSLPDEDHPLHKLLVLCRYAKIEQTRLESEVTVIEPSKEEDVEIEIIDPPYKAPNQPTPVTSGHATTPLVTPSGEQFMLDTFATCTTSEELLGFARGFLSVHLLMIHIAALTLSTMSEAIY